MEEHTSTPWYASVDGKGRVFAICSQGEESRVIASTPYNDLKLEDAVFIVRAVNSYQPMLDYIKSQKCVCGTVIPCRRCQIIDKEEGK